MKKILFAFFALFALMNTVAAQKNLDRYRIDFVDKRGTPYSVARPWEYLSPRALARRDRYGIPINFDDLPVAPRYINAVTATGAKVLTTLKWFNSISVQADTVQIEKIRKMPFVRAVKATSKTRTPKASRPGGEIVRRTDYTRTSNPYGYGYNQIKMLNGVVMHDLGYDGTGMMICIMDGGFQNADVMPFFDSIRAEKRLIATHDFTDGDDFVYDHSNHGTYVFGCIGANLPGLLIGTAPKASFVLLKTEDASSETPQEEDNWAAGVEYADSIGADVVNSSLGYTVFDANAKFLSYKYDDLNGKKSRASLAATKAAKKGLLIVNSAGNSGGDDWHYVGTPADADSILSVAAVDRFGERAYFSSYGPTADGRIAPNVAARGFDAVSGNLSGYTVDSVSGTSFSSPITAGMVASLWSATPRNTNMEVIEALKMAGNQSQKPDDGLGFGIPDYYKAFYLLNDGLIDANGEDEVFVNRSGELNIATRNQVFNPLNADPLNVHIYNVMGQEVYTRETLATTELDRHKVQYWEKLPAGAYRVYVQRGRDTYNLLVLKG